MLQLDDYVVLVTGASTGLGRAIAVGAAQNGAQAVIINFARNAAEAEETAAEVRAAGAEAVLARGDVSSDEDCRAIASVAMRFGRIDALFNNAGVSVFAPHDALDAISGEDFQRIFAVNVVGAFQMIRACRAGLEAGARPGAVVNTSSVGGIAGIGSSVPYAASKAALNMMTVSLARALAPKIRVNAICPGYMDTPWFSKGMSEESIRETRARASRVSPLNLASSAEDIAPAALFLAGRGAAHITGETLLVDAGLHLNRSQPIGTA